MNANEIMKSMSGKIAGSVKHSLYFRDGKLESVNAECEAGGYCMVIGESVSDWHYKEESEIVRFLYAKATHAVLSRMKKLGVVVDEEKINKFMDIACSNAFDVRKRQRLVKTWNRSMKYR